ncbi:threonine/serine dehydratase [Bosea sp. F3-2]|uniref:threonine/serine dehydratase n=1 Tax=Bosea sp. F3-2 TaxID=2599640 RepID=UPI0011EE895E|nr:threonine/serine dehydratase [Bosea sp. F3-2]QEL22510.1 threonine/serine dehydratase [Bosea sp. F3-2]
MSSERNLTEIAANSRFSISYSDVASASGRISRHAIRTPIIVNDELDRLLSARVLLKAETLQVTGSFKFRGALNRVSRMTADERKGGIVAWSSGNHALAISAVAARHGIKATILMPSDAPRAKIEGAQRFGGIVRLYDRATEVRETIGAEIAAATGAIIIPPYDDPDIMAGQGTVALEIAEQARERGVELDMLAVSCSGGGLAAGCAVAVQGASPQTRVYCVEPEGFDDTARSLASGRREGNKAEAKSLCDALQVAMPGELTFPVNQALLAGALVVTDAEVKQAMRVAYDLLKLVVEPGGVAPLAAALAGKLDVAGNAVALVLSGGNVDHDKFAACIAG